MRVGELGQDGVKNAFSNQAVSEAAAAAGARETAGCFGPTQQFVKAGGHMLLYVSDVNTRSRSPCQISQSCIVRVSHTEI